MSSDNLWVLVLGIIAAVALIVFLNVKNQKDKKDMNPDADDAVEEKRMDGERDKEKT